MTKESDKTAFHAKIHGRVQGVGFRYNTRREAKRYNVAGYIRNLSDGSVEVVCEGTKSEVESFAKWLGKGPPGAHVTDVDLRRVPYQGKYGSFTVEF